MSDDDDLEMADSGTAEDAPADESAVSKRAYTRKLNAIERRDAESREFWRQVLAHPIGKREIWGILADASTFGERFACGPNGFPQSEATWFHAGEQALGLRLFLRLQMLDPEGVFAMQREHDPRFSKPSPPKRKRRA